MATIDIKLTQAAYDRAAVAAEPGSLFRDLMSMMADAAAGVQDDSGDVSGYTFDNGSFRLNFPDGSFDEFTGINSATPGALKGTAMATGARLFVPGEGQSQQRGIYNFSYDLSGAKPQATRLSSLTTSITVESLYPASSLEHDAVLGNGKLDAKGTIAVDEDGMLSGSIFNLTFTPEKVLRSFSLDGVFQVSGNVRSIGDGDSELAVDGSLARVDMLYLDGSHVVASGLAAQVDGARLGSPLLLALGAASPGDDSIRVELPAVLKQIHTVASGDGNDTITLAGGGGMLHAEAGAGQDTIIVASGSHRIDGGAGLDTLVYGGVRGAYTIAKTAAGFTVSGNGGVDTVSNVERVHFGADGVAFDVTGTAGKAYRVYQAAFDRAPDKGGLGFWIGALEKGVSLEAVAGGFIDSAEFVRLYGANPTNEAFVTRLYANVLHRPYEQAGFDFWVAALNKGVAREAVLASFSESTENQAQVIGTIQNGMEFTLPGA